MKNPYAKATAVLVLVCSLVMSYPAAGGAMYFEMSSSTTYGGRAAGIAIYTPLSELTFADTGQLPSVGGVLKSDVPLVVNQLVNGDTLVATTNGFDGGAGSMTSISEITLLPNTSYAITADFAFTETLVSSTGDAYGRSQIVDLHVAGQAINITGQPNQVVSLPGVLTLVINEQIKSTQNGINSITVNALHLKLLTGEEIIISGSTSRISLDSIITPLVSQSHSTIYFIDHDDDDDDDRDRDDDDDDDDDDNKKRGDDDDDDDWDDDDDNDRKKKTNKNYAEGSGYIRTTNDGKGEFGFIAGYYKSDGKKLDGELKYKDKKAKIELKSKEITSFSGSGNTRTFSGTAKLDDKSGTYTFTVTVTDNGKGKNTDTFEINISNGYSASGLLKKGNIHVFGKATTNNPPVAADDSATTNEDTPVTINVLANDSDPEGDTLSVTSVSTPSSGTATINADKTITYSPNQDFSGTDSFTYTISDGKGGNDTATVTVTVTNVNDLPIAADDSVEVLESFAAQSIVDSLDYTRYKQAIRDVTNFGDRVQGSQSNIDALAWAEQELASMGYEVNRHTFTFSGESRDNLYATKIGATKPNQMYMIGAHIDGVHGGEAADDDGSGVALVLESARAFANPGVKTDVSIRFMLFNNEETNLAGSSAYVQDRLALQGLEFPPASGLYPEPTWLGMINHDMILFDHGIPPQQQQNPSADIDIEYRWDAQKADEASLLAKLIQSANSKYSKTYPSEIGAMMCCVDSWSFRDHTAAISIMENQAFEITIHGSNPHWHADTDRYTTYSEEDFQFGFDSARMTTGLLAEVTGVIAPININVLANDSDPDGNTLSVASTSTPSRGTATINPDNTITYTPHQNFVGTDSFTYTISDGNGGSDTATVTITITAVNEAPLAADDLAETHVNTPATVDVLANDSDPDGDTLLLDSFDASSQYSGTVTRDNNGTPQDQSDDKLVYTPPQNAWGQDTFTDTISDGNGGSDTAKVTVTIYPVNDPPIAVDDSAQTGINTPVTIPVLANDFDPNGDPLSVTTVTQGTSGSVIINSDNTVTYTPNPNFIGVDSFTYTISDGFGGTDTATVTVTVSANTPTNNPPTAADDSAITNEDTKVTIDVLANDSDPNGDTISIISFDSESQFEGAVTRDDNGTPLDQSDDKLVYAPPPNGFGADTFTYRISDGNGGSDTAKVTVTVNSVNDPPVAVDDSAETERNTPVTINVLANDSDLDGDALLVTSTSTASSGTVVINTDNTVTYAPSQNFVGTDSFTYTMSDGNGGSDTATVTLTVSGPAANKSPTAADDSAQTIVNVPATVDVLANDSDPDGDTLLLDSFDASSQYSGTVTRDNNGTPQDQSDDKLVYTPPQNAYGTDTFIYTISDGKGGSDTATVTVTVTGIGAPPVAANDSAQTQANTPVTINVLANDFNTNILDLSVVSTSAPLGGTVQINPDDTITYTPNQGFVGIDSFLYVITNSRGGLDSAIVTVTVQ